MANGCSWISVEELKNKLEAKESLHLVDLSSETAFNLCHLPGAKKATVFESDFSLQIRNFSKPEDSLVLCARKAHAKDVGVAFAKLSVLGYKRLFALIGGVEAWEKAGLPLEGKEHHQLSKVPDRDKTLSFK